MSGGSDLAICHYNIVELYFDILVENSIHLS